HAVAVGFDDGVGVDAERVGRFAGTPAADVLEGLREIPVKHRDVRLDTFGEHRVDEAVVEGDALRVHGAGAVGEDARPGEGEPVVFDAELPHEREVLFVAMVVIASDVEGVAIGDLSGNAREAIPDGFAFAVREGGALDLGSGGGDAPGEVPRKLVGHGAEMSDSGPKTKRGAVQPVDVIGTPGAG